MDDVRLGMLVQRVEDIAAEGSALAGDVRRLVDGCVPQAVCSIQHGEIVRRIVALEVARELAGSVHVAGRWQMRAALIGMFGSVIGSAVALVAVFVK
jgi:hypothetical protein